MLELLFILLVGGDFHRNDLLEDSDIANAAMTVSHLIAGPESIRIYEPHRKGITIGAVDPVTECTLAVEWDKRAKFLWPLMWTCP